MRRCWKIGRQVGIRDQRHLYKRWIILWLHAIMLHVTAVTQTPEFWHIGRQHCSRVAFKDVCGRALQVLLHNAKPISINDHWDLLQDSLEVILQDMVVRGALGACMVVPAALAACMFCRSCLVL
jgi:hypothetical protein